MKIKVCTSKDFASFICGVWGDCTITALVEIEKSLPEWEADGDEMPDGTYEYDVWWETPQVGDEGRVEIAGYWCLHQIGYEEFDAPEEADASDVGFHVSMAELQQLSDDADIPF
jgi:hypothetical protein